MNSMNRIFRFEGFVLDPSRRTLCSGRREIVLRPKTFTLLVYLVEHRHRVVSRKELLAGVWPGLRIEPQGVFQSISELRAAFGRHDFIRTVRGVGYEWVAPTKCGPRGYFVPGRALSIRWSRAALAAVMMIGFACAGVLFNYSANPDAMLDQAYARFEQGDHVEAHQLARESYIEAVLAGEDYPRMASAALLSRSPLLDNAAAEFYALEAVDFGIRLRAPDFAAAGHERLGELLIERGQAHRAAVHLHQAIESYTGLCPDSAERVRGLLATLALEG